MYVLYDFLLSFSLSSLSVLLLIQSLNRWVPSLFSSVSYHTPAAKLLLPLSGGVPQRRGGAFSSGAACLAIHAYHGGPHPGLEGGPESGRGAA